MHSVVLSLPLALSLSLSQLEGKSCKHTMHITDMLLYVLWQHPPLSSFQQHFITRQARNSTTMKCHGNKSLLLNLPIRQGKAIDPILVVTIKSSQTIISE